MQYPQHPFLNSIYMIFWDRVANRNNFTPGLHLSASVRHAELNALALLYSNASATVFSTLLIGFINITDSSGKLDILNS